MPTIKIQLTDYENYRFQRQARKTRSTPKDFLMRCVNKLEKETQEQIIEAALDIHLDKLQDEMEKGKGAK